MENDATHPWKNFEDMLTVYIVFPYSKTSDNIAEPTEYETLQEALTAYNKIVYEPNNEFTHKCLALEIWVPVSGDAKHGFDRELFTSFIELDEPIQPNRAETLLLAARNLLNKQKDSDYVLNLLAETVPYDETECDGTCLIDDIEAYLNIEED